MGMSKHMPNPQIEKHLDDKVEGIHSTPDQRKALLREFHHELGALNSVGYHMNHYYRVYRRLKEQYYPKPGDR